jgi:hypothetical protein
MAIGDELTDRQRAFLKTAWKRKGQHNYFSWVEVGKALGCDRIAAMDLAMSLERLRFIGFVDHQTGQAQFWQDGRFWCKENSASQVVKRAVKTRTKIAVGAILALAGGIILKAVGVYIESRIPAPQQQPSTQPTTSKT